VRSASSVALSRFVVCLPQVQRTTEAEDEFGRLKSKLVALMNIANTYAKEPQGNPTNDLSKRLERLTRYIF